MTEWQTKAVGEIADTQLGKMLNKGKQSGKYSKPYLRTDNVHWGRFDLSEIKEMDILPDEQDKYLATRGDLLMCEGGASGRTAIWNEDYDISFQNHVHRIRPKNPQEISPKYLLYYFEWFIKNGYASDLIKGVTISSLSQSGLRSIEVAYPPIDEQLKIVELLEDHLSRLDAALTDVKQAKLKASQFRRSLLQAAFSGKFVQESGYGGVNWAISELGELCTLITDGSHNPPKGIEKSEYLMLSSRDINNGELSFDKPRYLSKKDFDSENSRTDLQIDDVLLTTVGTIGRTAIYSGMPKNVTFQRSVSVLRTNKEKISSKFLMYFLDSLTELLNREARGVAQQGIYLNQVRRLEIPVPSLDEQLFIVELLDDYLSRLDSSVKLADLMEKQASALRRSLLQAAFTGQLSKEVASV
jgi:type I restriction enzyme S subunit